MHYTAKFTKSDPKQPCIYLDVTSSDKLNAWKDVILHSCGTCLIDCIRIDLEEKGE